MSLRAGLGTGLGTFTRGVRSRLRCVALLDFLPVLLGSLLVGHRWATVVLLALSCLRACSTAALACLFVLGTARFGTALASLLHCCSALGGGLLALTSLCHCSSALGSGLRSRLVGRLGRGLLVCRLGGSLLVGRLRRSPVGRLGRSLLVGCLLYTSPSPRDGLLSRMPSSA